ncbi:MAG: cysteine hydrolase [Acetobacteraceae bacterium]
MLIIDMQNDFLHTDGWLAHRAKALPDGAMDMPFLMDTIPQVRRLADAFRSAQLPVVYVVTARRSDNSDAQVPFWRPGFYGGGNRTFVAEGSWGARIVDDLEPREGEHVVIKKGYGGFSNTPLDTILRNIGVTTCVVAGVTTCVCVSTTIRGGVEHNYRMILVGDAVAEVSRDTHEAELRTMARIFADVKTTDEVIATLADISRG